MNNKSGQDEIKGKIKDKKRRNRTQSSYVRYKP